MASCLFLVPGATTSEFREDVWIARLEAMGYTVTVAYNGTTSSIAGTDWSSVDLLFVAPYGTLSNVKYTDHSAFKNFDVNIFCTDRHLASDPNGLGFTTQFFLNSGNQAQQTIYRLAGVTDDRASLSSAAYNSFTDTPYIDNTYGYVAGDVDKFYRNQYSTNRIVVAERYRDTYSRLWWGLINPDRYSDDLWTLFEAFIGEVASEPEVPIVPGASNQRSLWRCILSADGLDDLTVPISSWQGTLQTSGRQSYIQAVVPAAIDLYASIQSYIGGTITIYSCAVDSEGETCSEFLSGPLDTVRFDRGATNASVTVSGYWDAGAYVADSLSVDDVHTLSISDGTRVRVPINGSIRPGWTMTAAGVSFTASYINYYVNRTASYMDVGESAL